MRLIRSVYVARAIALAIGLGVSLAVPADAAQKRTTQRKSTTKSSVTRKPAYSATASKARRARLARARAAARARERASLDGLSMRSRNTQACERWTTWSSRISVVCASGRRQPATPWIHPGPPKGRWLGPRAQNGSDARILRDDSGWLGCNRCAESGRNQCNNDSRNLQRFM